MTLLLEHDKGSIALGESTLVFALDETGHEEFKDENYQVYGIGGCAFLVKDYQRLIETPFNYMCDKYFKEVVRPFHITEIQRNISKEQIDALNHLFEKFMFFRVSNTMTINTENETDINNIRLITASLTSAISDIARQAIFDRVFIIFEDSQRTGNKVLRGLSGYKLKSSKREIEIELALMPKSATMPALELADIIIHTAGRQTRNRLDGRTNFLKDFESVFKKIDQRLVSFKEILRVENI